MTRNISWYSALVHFKNMGLNDNLFDSSIDSHGGYSCLYAKVDKEETFKKLIENYANAYKTCILSIEDIRKRTDINNDDADKLIHYLGIYNDQICTYPSKYKNIYGYTYKYKKSKPIWRSADVLLKNKGKEDRLFSCMPPKSKIGKIHLFAKTSTKELFTRLIKNYISTYNSEIIEIENIKIEQSINNSDILMNMEIQWLGVYGDGRIQVIE